VGSTERSILARLKTNCAAVDGSGAYNYDFSATGSVVLGSEPAGVAPRAPGVYIYPVALQSSRNAGRTPLNRYTREFVVQIDVWVPRTAGTAESAILAAVDAQSDIMRALEADPTCGGVTHDIEIEASAYDGEALQVPGYGIAALKLTLEYHEKRGE
tara:strand:- start:1632 stop:2102 length:471 start_codon:yes stop_codon:yes gene_type:complete